MYQYIHDFIRGRTLEFTVYIINVLIDEFCLQSRMTTTFFENPTLVNAFQGTQMTSYIATPLAVMQSCVIVEILHSNKSLQISKMS